MEIPIYQVDAFTDSVFSGNPAAVCPLNYWLPDELLQSIALENNLSETAYFVREGAAYHLRWFTPVAEVKLCGHATLASAFVLFNFLKTTTDTIRFKSLSGSLLVERQADGSMTMDFPKENMEPCRTPQTLWESLGAHPIECFKGEDYMAIMDSEQTVRHLQPDFRQMATLPTRGLIVTARGEHCDFVSRFFAPRHHIDEDPVTGSAHCATAPYWANKLNKDTLSAIQLSERGGTLNCRVSNDRVFINGHAVLFFRGRMVLPGVT